MLDPWLIGRPETSVNNLELSHPRCVCNIKVQGKEVKTQQVVICNNVFN
jgi:hypothetical protein